MGSDIKLPDANSIAKRLAKPSRPCTAELLGLMDCMKVCGRGELALQRCPSLTDHR
jgi:hypothetical protein